MKLLTFIILFIFNILYIDSNSSKRLVYDINDNYDNKLNTVYFINLNTNDLEEKQNIFDIQILSYIINDKKYYARNIEKLKEQFFKDKISLITLSILIILYIAIFLANFSSPYSSIIFANFSSLRLLGEEKISLIKEQHISENGKFIIENTKINKRNERWISNDTRDNDSW